MVIHDRPNPFFNVIQLNELSAPTHQGFSSDTDANTSDDNGSIVSILLQTSSQRVHSCRPLVSPFQIQNYRKNRRIQRRLDMLNTIRDLVDIAETDENWEPVPRRKSAFYQLLSDHQKMQMWNEFVELNEEDQNSFLNEASEDKEVECEITEEFGEKGCDSSSDEFVFVQKCSKDKRAVHPSYSSDECFRRIERRQRVRLLRHAPYGMMKQVENDLRRCFAECSYTIYDSEMETSFGRLVVYIIAEYLGLDAYTVEWKGGRKIQVVNVREHFSPPPDLLSEFLEKRLYQHEQ